MNSPSAATTHTLPTSSNALWRMAAIGLPTGLTLLLYWWSGAPGLTWAHHGADGGDLLAAAVVNGVPHPPGYPLYTLLLRAWLWLGQLFHPTINLAAWGNRLSAISVAAATAFTIAACAALLPNHPHRWLWAALAGSAFALTTLAWSQALITEVYGLHICLVAALGWSARRPTYQPRRASLLMGILMGLGIAHHLTTILLWPALLYWRNRRLARTHQWRLASLTLITPTVITAFVIAAAFYANIVWRIATAPAPIPVAWGNPHNLEGLWWLISGAAYRAYLFGMTPAQFIGRVASLASVLVEQYTPLGLAFIIAGFALWDRHRPPLRNGALLWTLPISLYAAGYNTVDSYIYLLPVVWLMALMLGQALAGGSAWLATHLTWATPRLLAILVGLSLISMTAWRFPQVDLRHDHAAETYLANAASTLTPGSLVISSADAATFTLWYGYWGSRWGGEGDLARTVPDLILVNYALYQFPWYRDHLRQLYPDIPMMGTPFTEMIAANRALRPIYLTEPLPIFPATEVTPMGAFWHLTAIAPE